MNLQTIFPLNSTIHIADIGAAYIAETPVYKSLVDKGLAKLTVFDGDQRQIAKLKEVYNDNVVIHSDIIADGNRHKMYLAAAVSGMTSLLEPSEHSLNFFNGFNDFGKIEKIIDVETKKLDDIDNLEPIDFLKMDIQGSELMVLMNGRKKLKDCVLIQLEVSFITLYKNQPTFGEIDVWMRENGYLPHCFTDVKRWSISPTVINNDIRMPFNQLLEADIVYMKDPLNFSKLSDSVISKLLYLSFLCYKSIDLAVFCAIELQRRGVVPANSVEKLYAQLNS